MRTAWSRQALHRRRRRGVPLPPERQPAPPGPRRPDPRSRPGLGPAPRTRPRPLRRPRRPRPPDGTDRPVRRPAHVVVEITAGEPEDRRIPPVTSQEPTQLLRAGIASRIRVERDDEQTFEPGEQHRRRRIRIARTEGGRRPIARSNSRQHVDDPWATTTSRYAPDSDTTTSPTARSHAVPPTAGPPAPPSPWPPTASRPYTTTRQRWPSAIEPPRTHTLLGDPRHHRGRARRSLLQGWETRPRRRCRRGRVVRVTRRPARAR
jgi:hypothetical protein